MHKPIHSQMQISQRYTSKPFTDMKTQEHINTYTHTYMHTYTHYIHNTHIIQAYLTYNNEEIRTYASAHMKTHTHLHAHIHKRAHTHTKGFERPKAALHVQLAQLFKLNCVLQHAQCTEFIENHAINIVYLNVFVETMHASKLSQHAAVGFRMHLFVLFWG